MSDGPSQPSSSGDRYGSDFRTELTPWMITTRPAASTSCLPRSRSGPAMSGSDTDTTPPVPDWRWTSGWDGVVHAATNPATTAIQTLDFMIPRITGS